MSNVNYNVTVTGGDVQTFSISGGGTNQVVSEADTDAAVQAFANSLASTGTVVVNSIRKVTTFVTETAL